MAKTNYTKVEEMLDQGLRKITVEHLFEMADVAAATGNPPAGTEKKGQQPDKAQSHLITSLQRELKMLKKQEQDIYVKLGIKKKVLKRMIENPQDLTPEDWQSLKQIQEKIIAFREELKKKLPSVNNDELVETERFRHLTKRFNVNEKWLPLK